MALVITLILLSVSLVMVIAFLAVSKRERASVTTNAELTTARLAADSALAAAQAQILANIFTTNAALHNYHLLVSTNYINGFGFEPGLPSNPTNVNYDYHFNNNLPVTGAEFPEVVANLQFLPRAPVFVNATAADTNGGRFYLDLNRNGVFEPTSDSVSNLVVDASLNTFFTDPISAVGDPQWVGILERPGQLHAADNKFLSRYAFIALPVGQSLDINAIHNYANGALQDPSMQPGQDVYMRNQGVGSWEINLAAFLTDLNTNQWDPDTTMLLPQPLWNYGNNAYSYNTPNGAFNSGAAFEDAVSLLRYRYNENYSTLAPAGLVFQNLPAPPNIFGRDNVDIYSDGPLQIAPANINENFTFAGDGDINTATAAWPGSDNLVHFYSLADFFDRNKTQKAKIEYGIPGPGFTDRLSNAVNTVVNNGARPTYDRYTFYRMLDQLGTDSEPETGKINLNYRNLTNGAVVVGMETNLYQWSAIEFFTNAANRLLLTYTTNWFQKNPSNFLATYYGFTGDAANYYWRNTLTGVITTNDPTGYGLTNVPFFGMTNEIPGYGIGNLPVIISNNLIYSPSINRLLQLAANIYDAGGNNATTPGGVDYPHVFRPQFLVNLNADLTKNVFITGYEEVRGVSGISDVQLAQPIDIGALTVGTHAYPTRNVYGVPWIVGAKKYLPNFNAFYSFNTLQVGRKLQFTRTAVEGWSQGTTSSHFMTNQMLVMSITNHMGFSFWNSYMSNYPSLTAPLVFAGDYVSMRLSSGSFSHSQQAYFPLSANLTTWPGSAWNVSQLPDGRDPYPNSFVTFQTNFPFVHEAMLDLDQAGNVQGTGFRSQTFAGAATSLPPFPDFELATTNRFQGFILDNGHVIDYVQFAGPVTVRQLGEELRDVNHGAVGANYSFWSTNLNVDGLNWGVVGQIDGSKKGNVSANLWKAIPNVPASLSSQDNQARFFAAFFTGEAVLDGNGKSFQNTNLVQQAPFSPVRTVTAPSYLAVNDPLVHYLASDMNAPLTGLTNAIWRDDDPSHPTLPYPSLSSLESGTPIPKRYQPWGSGGQLNEITGDGRFTHHLGLKDPLVWGSDNWDFPNNPYPSIGWLGRVHRGTPWQSVYLKATNFLEYADSALINHPNTGFDAWMTWLGDTDEFDGANSRPIQDALLFDLFTTASHPNATRGTLSANQNHLAAWSAVLSGIQVLTNITEVPAFDFPPVLTNLVIQPAGLNVVDSPVFQIVNGADGINATRANKNLFPDGAFRRVGDILRVPALTEVFPFINREGVVDGDDRLQKDISDEQYEWLPQQMLGLLRVDAAPRYVVYSYGQTLKPAPGGTVLSSPYFQLVTNYQVVAESATRAVITVLPVIKPTGNGPVTNYNLRVESFNVLPPE
ncbi:MAG: hypothetical protein RL616_1229 [Verrucomicrobiota bacterium]